MEVSADLFAQVSISAEMEGKGRTQSTLVDHFSIFANEVTRVAQELGIEGKLGVQASLHDVHGTWKETTLKVNTMTSNLTGQTH